MKDIAPIPKPGEKWQGNESSREYSIPITIAAVFPDPFAPEENIVLFRDDSPHAWPGTYRGTRLDRWRGQEWVRDLNVPLEEPTIQVVGYHPRHADRRFEFDMVVVAEVLCHRCNAPIPRGAACWFENTERGLGYYLSCIECAAKELLPIWDAEHAARLAKAREE